MFVIYIYIYIYTHPSTWAKSILAEVWIHTFPSHWRIAIPKLKNPICYLHIAGGGENNWTYIYIYIYIYVCVCMCVCVCVPVIGDNYYLKSLTSLNLPRVNFQTTNNISNLMLFYFTISQYEIHFRLYSADTYPSPRGRWVGLNFERFRLNIFFLSLGSYRINA